MYIQYEVMTSKTCPVFSITNFDKNNLLSQQQWLKTVNVNFNTPKQRYVHLIHCISVNYKLTRNPALRGART